MSTPNAFLAWPTPGTNPERGYQVLVAADLPSSIIAANPVLTTINYTASPNDVVLADTSGAPITVTLPGTPTLGQKVTFIDVAGTWNTNNLTVNGNGANIFGIADTLVSNNARENFILIYANTAQGWTLGI
jgi:hypothetical protein